MTRTYELTVVYSPKLSEDKQAKELKALESLLGKLKGEIKKADHWGKKLLVYPLKRHTEAYFAHWQVNLPVEAVKKLRKEFKVVDNILRYLLVTKK